MKWFVAVIATMVAAVVLPNGPPASAMSNPLHSAAKITSRSLIPLIGSNFEANPADVAPLDTAANLSATTKQAVAAAAPAKLANISAPTGMMTSMRSSSRTFLVRPVGSNDENSPASTKFVNIGLSHVPRAANVENSRTETNWPKTSDLTITSQFIPAATTHVQLE